MSETMRLRAVGHVFLLPAAAFTGVMALGSGLVVSDQQTWLAWLFLQAVVASAGLIAAVWVGARALTIDTERLRFTSINRRLSWRLSDITAVTYEGHFSQSWHAHIALHHVDGDALALNVYIWRQSELAALLQALMQANPAIRFSPAAQSYLAVAQ